MSWVVEQSPEASTVSINGDTIKCTKEGDYGNPVNVMYKDPANRNGEYFWEVTFIELETQGGSASVSVTTDEGFQNGWALKGMKYLGNLSDGSSLLVQAFGDPIRKNDKIGLLLQLTDADLKLYIFHNDRPLGLAFHFQAPYTKPLYPIVTFDSSGKAKLTRVQQIPATLNRTLVQPTGLEGSWNIVNYSQHPECVGCRFDIKRHHQNTYRLNARVINNLNCTLEHKPATNQWKVSPVLSTMMAGPPEEMDKESAINSLISGLQDLKFQGDHQLIIQTNDGQQVQLGRSPPEPPRTVTQNIFN